MPVAVSECARCPCGHSTHHLHTQCSGRRVCVSAAACVKPPPPPHTHPPLGKQGLVSTGTPSDCCFSDHGCCDPECNVTLCASHACGTCFCSLQHPAWHRNPMRFVMWFSAMADASAIPGMTVADVPFTREHPPGTIFGPASRGDNFLHLKCTRNGHEIEHHASLTDHRVLFSISRPSPSPSEASPNRHQLNIDCP